MMPQAGVTNSKLTDNFCKVNVKGRCKIQNKILACSGQRLSLEYNLSDGCIKASVIVIWHSIGCSTNC